MAEALAINGADLADDAGPQVERIRAANVCAVPPAMVPQVYGKLAPWIEAALASSVQHELTVDEVYTGLTCENPPFALLVMQDADTLDLVAAVVLGKGERNDGFRYVAVICLGGREMERWLPDIVDRIKAIARDVGADHVCLMGRPGWVRALRKHGLEQRAAVMVWNVNGGEHGKH